MLCLTGKEHLDLLCPAGVHPFAGKGASIRDIQKKHVEFHEVSDVLIGVNK